MENEIIVNIVEQLNALWEPVKIVALFIGYLLIGLGLFWFAMSADRSRGVSPYSCIMMIVAGIFLVSFDSFLRVASYSLFDQSSNLDALGYSASTISGVWEKFSTLGFAVLKFLGLIAGIKAIYTMYSMTQDRRSSVFTVVLYLALAVIGLNFPHFLDIVGASLGGVVETSINKALEAANI